MSDVGILEAVGGKRKSISVGGQPLVVCELGVDNLEAFGAVLGSVVELIPGSGGAGAELLSSLLAKAPGSVIKGVQIGLRIPQDAMQAMSATELRFALKAVLELNADFLSGVLSDLEQAKMMRGSMAGLMPSSPSSALAIDLPTSGVTE